MVAAVRARQFETPFGLPLAVAVRAEADVVVAAGFMELDRLIVRHDLMPQGDDIGSVAHAVLAWLDGDLAGPGRVVVDQPGTKFRQRAWTVLRDVPCGDTVTYGELAAMMGSPGAARAVGTACATNRVAPFVPCHRVVPAGGGVGRYGYGPGLKSALLAREKA